MRATIGRFVTGTLCAALIGLLVLVGCDKSLKGDDPISPDADVRITSINGIAANAIITPAVGSLGGTGGTTVVAMPVLQVRVRIFNGVSVTFQRYVVDYFQEDGVTPLGVRQQTGFLDRFVLGGFPDTSNLTSIAPVQGSTGVLVNGITPEVVLNIPATTPEVDRILAGSDGVYGTGDEPDRRISAKITIFGLDINNNSFQAQARFTASPTQTAEKTQ